jgi:hypothetical protein
VHLCSYQSTLLLLLLFVVRSNKIYSSLFLLLLRPHTEKKKHPVYNNYSAALHSPPSSSALDLQHQLSKKQSTADEHFQYFSTPPSYYCQVQLCTLSLPPNN